MPISKLLTAWLRSQRNSVIIIIIVVVYSSIHIVDRRIGKRRDDDITHNKERWVERPIGRQRNYGDQASRDLSRQ